MKTLTPADFLNQDVVKDALKRAQSFKDSGKVMSDVVDDQGHQYVDLVQEGGGVLGIALVGYSYVLETAGIRFFHCAGTSAGAINTLMISALGTVDEMKSPKVLHALAAKNLFDFVDGDPATKKILQAFMDGKKGAALLLPLVLNVRKILHALTDKMGLNPADAFESWVDEILDAEGVTDSGKLEELRMKMPAGLRMRSGDAYETDKARVVIITSDVTTQTKVEFPEMARMYWAAPRTVKPSKYARASMSVPIFFTPFTVSHIPQDDKATELWRNRVSYHGTLPTKARFVDGGMLSNFPINVFHSNDRMPRKPTFGVRLSAYRDQQNDTDGMFKYAGAMLNTMRHIYDLVFILRNPDYQKLICKLDVDKEFNWLDFNMSNEKKLALFAKGAEGAIKFLEGFDWEGYKGLRKSILDANKALIA